VTTAAPHCDRCGSTVVWDDQGPQFCDPCALASIGARADEIARITGTADTEPATRPAVCTQCGGSGVVRVHDGARVLAVVCGACRR
jgi:endogenous inhibitor of DNA gyrase (YacG/DUF329 family)